MEKYYTPQEIADMYNLKPGAVRTWIREKKIPALKLGKEYRVSQEELDNFIESSKTVGTAEALDMAEAVSEAKRTIYAVKF